MAQTLNALFLNAPMLEIAGQTCALKGDWVIAAVKNPRQLQNLQAQIKRYPPQDFEWDLRGTQLDHICAGMLWQCWGRQMPERTLLAEGQADLFKRIARYTPPPEDMVAQNKNYGFFATIGFAFFNLLNNLLSFIQLLGQFVLDIGQAIKSPSKAPWKDFSGQLLHMGAKALPITGLVGFLVGIVIVYLMSSFLRSYGLELYIINMIGLISLRELGPLLAAILVAGRSGSTITAQIGVMRLREELDAMHVLGISATFRLVLPRVLALGIAMPLISLWASLLSILGGMITAQISIDISYHYFLTTLPTTVSSANIWMNLGKSAVFGMLIALIGCYFGLKVKADTESLGNGTTASVVASITCVMLADAIFAILCRNVPI